MTYKIVPCLADDDFQKALDAMTNQKLRRIPIVDCDNRIVGIITQADVAARINQPEKIANVVREISQN